ARPSRPRGRRVPQVRRATGPVDGERTGRRVDRRALLQRLGTPPGIARRARGPPVDTRPARAGEPWRAPAAGGGLARAGAERPAAGAASAPPARRGPR